MYLDRGVSKKEKEGEGGSRAGWELEHLNDAEGICTMGSRSGQRQLHVFLQSIRCWMSLDVAYLVPETPGYTWSRHDKLLPSRLSEFQRPGPSPSFVRPPTQLYFFFFFKRICDASVGK